MKIGVLGSGGQIGSAFVRLLAEDGTHAMVAIVRNSISAVNLVGLDSCEIRIVPELTAQNLNAALRDCDVVVNCALASGLPRASRVANVALLANLAASTNGGGRWQTFVQLSSVAVYGPCFDRSTGSTFDRPRPRAAYGREKLHVEREVDRLFRASGVRHVIVRVGHVYGPHQAHSSNILRLAASPNFALPFAGELPSNAIHIDSLSRALGALTTWTKSGATYNAIDIPGQTWRSLFEWHTGTVGLASVQLLDHESSVVRKRALLRDMRRPRLLRALGAVARDTTRAAVRSAAASPDVRDLAQSFLVRAPHAVESKVKHAHANWSARDQIRRLPGMSLDIEPYFFSDAMPGPNLLDALPAGSANLPPSANELAAWVYDRSWPEWAGGASPRRG